MNDLVPVTQADRDAAKALFEALQFERVQPRDNGPTVQAFARHRIAHSTEQPTAAAGLADELERISTAMPDGEDAGHVWDAAKIIRSTPTPSPSGEGGELIERLEAAFNDAFALPCHRDDLPFFVEQLSKQGLALVPADTIATLQADKARLEAAGEGLRRAVHLAAAWFDEYALLHRQKGTAEGNDKGQRNQDRADQLRASLTEWEALHNGK